MGEGREAAETTELKLGAIPGATPDKWVARWRERFPEVELTVEHLDVAGQLERVCSGRVDVGYFRVPAGEPTLLDPDVFHRVVLYTEDPVVCASRDHWVAAAEASVTWEEIAGEPFAELDAGEGMALEVVASGAALLVLPNSVARMGARKDVVIRRVEDLPGYDVGLCWLRDRDDEVIQEFIGVARGRRAGSGRTGLRREAGPAASEPRRRRRGPRSRPARPPRGRRRSR